MRLSGKVALISGGARGMGAAHSRAIVREGGKVVIADIAADEGTRLAEELGDSALFVELDVTSTPSWANAVATAVRHFGKLNVLVNNAGILHSSPIESYADEDWDRLLAINLSGTFKGMRAAVPELRKHAPASIINISSTAGLKGFAMVTAYVTSKFGVRGMTKAAAIELAPDRIRVNSIHPGNIATDMIAGVYPNFHHVPMDRAGQPDEISALVIYLASDESSFSTGAEFVADGGETAGVVLQFDP